MPRDPLYIKNMWNIRFLRTYSSIASKPLTLIYYLVDQIRTNYIFSAKVYMHDKLFWEMTHILTQKFLKLSFTCYLINGSNYIDNIYVRSSSRSF